MYKQGESGNPSGRKKGCLNKRTMAAGAIKREYKSTEAFWDKIAKQANSGCMESLKILVCRVEPPFKPRSVATPLDTTAKTPSEFIPVVLQAIADGTMATEEAASLLGALNSGQQLLKLEELEAKINTLMESRNA
jgi:hypothetical protein